MTDELVKKYQDTGICIVPVGEYQRVKTKLEIVGEHYDCFWDNSMQVYIFEAKKGTLL